MERLIAWLGGEAEIERVVAVGVLVAARIAPVAWLAPWLAMRATPVLVRLGVALALTAALAPLALPTAEVPAPDAVTLSALAVREALLGAVFAVTAALPLYSLQWAGRLVDTWRGAGLAAIIDPATGERSSPLGELKLLMGVALFALLGGHRLALSTFAEALGAVPVGSATIGAGLGEVALGAARLVADALAFAAALAAPAAAAIVVVEVTLGVLARSAPQVPVFFAGMPLRAAVGLAASLLALSVVVGALPDAFRDAVEAAAVLMRRLAG